MFEPGERVGVAVSGGADSVYLLHYLLAQSLQLTVLHVNHKLRGAESDDDEAFVRGLAADLGLPCRVRVAPVPEGNLEEGAREARHSWFRELIRERAVERIALGHTQSDQAETVLFRFLRGAGTAGLAAIRPETSGGLVRPLLNRTREEIRTSLNTREIAWREDSSNGDARFARNRIRQDLLPQLAREWNPSIEASLAQTADWANAEEEYWAAEVRRVAASSVTLAPPYVLVKVTELPLALARRLIRHVIELAKGDLKQIGFAHVEQIRVLRAGRTQIPGLEIERSFDWMRLGPPVGSSGGAPFFRFPVRGPGTIHLGEAGSGFRLELSPVESVYNKGEHQLDWDRISGPLELRSWRPGDRYKRVGHSGEDKIKFLFQKKRIPAWERRLWPVLLCGGRVAWSRMFGAAADFGRTGGTRTVLVIREFHDSGENRNQKP
jgi:tRNA(Ile)-lysidine synthase